MSRRYRVRIVAYGTGFGFNYYTDSSPDVEAVESAYPHLEVCFVWDSGLMIYTKFL